ncbi:FAD-linked oxidase C-terminal domain-containing protein, partial [Azospirillum sp. B506]|uniref:FAD-linked oxidase C-terminal domain-containing protein n=1 Tax=Azospirillum sp. B506 TaxID=137721 RepID=UPI00244E4C5D
ARPGEPAELAEAQRFVDKMVGRALAMGGTCTGEHGIGYGKMAFLEQEAGEAFTVMGDLKRAFDPDNLLNPGKVVRV